MTPVGNNRWPVLLALAALCGGCSADSSTIKNLSGNSSALKTFTNSIGPGVSPRVTSADPPIEVYARVARGALKCWFGPEGSLKKTHVFHAKADSPTDGTPIEIAVLTRDEETSRGVLRAFAISITPSGSGSLVESKNIRFPAPQADLMIADVGRWSSGKDDCSVVGTGGWAAGAPSTGGGTATPAAAAKPPAVKKRP
jgi:hypothetical protein